MGEFSDSRLTEILSIYNNFNNSKDVGFVLNLDLNIFHIFSDIKS